MNFSLKLLLALGLSTSFALADGPKAAALESGRVKVAYDLDAGTFDLVELPSGRVVISGAHTQVEQWSSADPGVTRTTELSEGTDELGASRRLVVRCARPGAPTLVTEFSVYGDDDSFVTLRTGIENGTDEAVRIRDYRPLDGGLVSPDPKWDDVRLLNGDSACVLMKVEKKPYRRSANNLLLTFKEDGQRRSLVLGGLKVADFNKYVETSPSRSGYSLRALGLDGLLPGGKLAGYLDCGGEDEVKLLGGPAIAVAKGQTYRFCTRGNIYPRSDSVVSDSREVAFNLTGLDPKKSYAVGFSWWDYDALGRVESVTAVGADGQAHLLFDKQELPQFLKKDQRPSERAAALPAESYADGSVRLSFTNEGKAPNAVVGEIWLWELTDGAAIPAGLAQGQPVPVSDDALPEGKGLPVVARLESIDPIGRLVEAGSAYMPEDNFYVDFGTPNPFEALEQYGQRLAASSHAKPNVYDFPTVCAWYVGVQQTKGAQNNPDKSLYRINTSPGLVEEMGMARDKGFLAYSRLAVRLVPDTYRALNPKGWWDDAHWKEGGYYVAPYETSQKYGAAVHELGGLAFTYIQAHGALSQDFSERYANLLLGKDPKRTLDFTNPDAQQYMRKVFGALRGNIDGVMVDYCDDIWRTEAILGGFHDPHATSTSYYRTFFQFLKEGMGPDSWLHERNLFEPNNDLTLGTVDAQRTTDDTQLIAPDLVAQSGLRWYKNRVVLDYDMDSKRLDSGWKAPGFTGTDADGLRMMLTMSEIAGSRLLLATSFRDMSAQTVHDLERVFPYYGERRSARPLDAFVHPGSPRVYDFAVDPAWHQLVLYNNTFPTKEAAFSVALSGDTIDGAIGLDPAREYYVYDFWNNKFEGRVKGTAKLEQTLRAGEARMLSLHQVEEHPQFLSTNRHFMQGFVDMPGRPVWDAQAHTLRGTSNVVGGETYEIVVALNGFTVVGGAAEGCQVQVEPIPGDDGLALVKIDAPKNVAAEWRLECK